jgi:hypothetical protein
VDVLNQLNLQFNGHIVAGIGNMPELRWSEMSWDIKLE